MPFCSSIAGQAAPTVLAPAAILLALNEYGPNKFCSIDRANVHCAASPTVHPSMPVKNSGSGIKLIQSSPPTRLSRFRESYTSSANFVVVGKPAGAGTTGGVYGGV